MPGWSGWYEGPCVLLFWGAWRLIYGEMRLSGMFVWLLNWVADLGGTLVMISLPSWLGARCRNAYVHV